MLVFNLKRIIRLCKTLWYQFPSSTFEYDTEFTENTFQSVFGEFEYTFQSRKNIHWTQLKIKKFLSLRKNSSHVNFTHFPF